MHRNTLIDEELEIDETSIARILLFGPDLSQTWIGIGNRERADTIKNLGTTINGGFKVKYLRGPNQNPFILNTIFRTTREGGFFDETSGEYFLTDRMTTKCTNSDRILLCIRNILPYKKTQDFAELRAQLKKMIAVITDQQTYTDSKKFIKLGILLTNYSNKYDLLKPWDVLEKLKLVELCDELEFFVFWKILQIDVFDSKQDSHDSVDVFYQWLIK